MVDESAPSELQGLLKGDRDLHLLYGSQSGNAEGLCGLIAKKAKDYGLVGHVHNMEGFELRNMANMKRVLIACSTWGEGDQPDNAEALYTTAKGSGKILSKTHFSVCALGDTSYEFFCKSGKEWDEVLEKMGGTRIHDRVDCDVEFDEPAAAWTAQALSKIACVDDSGTFQEPLVSKMTEYAATKPSAPKSKAASDSKDGAPAGEKLPEASPPPKPDEFYNFLNANGVKGEPLGLDNSNIEMLKLDASELVKACELLKNEKDFDSLDLITTVEVKSGYQSVYSFCSTKNTSKFRMKVTLPKDNPIIPTVSHLWKSADWYEREAYDMMGVVYTGHPNLRRILNPDNWEGFPLRKDYIPPIDSLNGPHPLRETEMAEKFLSK